MDAGAEAVRRYGDLRSAQIYPKPHEVASALLANGTAEQLSGRALEPGKKSRGSA
jgi:ethanolamine utilization protein EutM